MKVSLNCLPLETLSFNNAFAVNVNDKNIIGNSQVAYKELKIADLKFLIYKDNYETKFNYKDMKLW
jgi:hypothetical protein